MKKEKKMISLQCVGYSYPDAGRPALGNVSFEVRQGEWIALVGSNGSGKSTLAKHLNALLLPMQGACYILGMDTRDERNLWKIRSNLSMVFQNPENQIVSTVVEDDAAFGPENMGLPSEEIRARVENALSICGLTEEAHRAVYTLSGGQKQRLAIAGALAMKSQCIVLDEPTAMLDSQGRNDVVQLLIRLHQENITIVQITHRLEEVLDADKVIVLSNGNVAWQGTPSELLKQKDISAWGLEVPPLMRLLYGLIDAGFVSADTHPCCEEIVSRLCQ